MPTSLQQMKNAHKKTVTKISKSGASFAIIFACKLRKNGKTKNEKIRNFYNFRILLP